MNIEQNSDRKAVSEHMMPPVDLEQNAAKELGAGSAPQQPVNTSFLRYPPDPLNLGASGGKGVVIVRWS